MAITIPSTAAISSIDSVTLPAHSAGDLIVVYAFHTNTGPPTLPTAAGSVPQFVVIDQGNGSFNSLTTAYAVATSNVHTSGTWANATGMIAVVLRGAKNSSPVGGHAIVATGFGQPTSAPAVTLVKTDGSSALLHFWGIGDSSNSSITTGWSGTPAGYTERVSAQYASNNRILALLTKDDTTSDGAVGHTGGNPWFLNTSIEILAAPPNPGFFTMF